MWDDIATSPVGLLLGMIIDNYRHFSDISAINVLTVISEQINPLIRNSIRILQQVSLNVEEDSSNWIRQDCCQIIFVCLHPCYLVFFVFVLLLNLLTSSRKVEQSAYTSGSANSQ